MHITRWLCPFTLRGLPARHRIEAPGRKKLLPAWPRKGACRMVERTDAGSAASASEPAGAADREGAPVFRAFLIADIRGWTSFTRERGAAAAGRLAKAFADLARDAVEARGGIVFELRGDEAVAVFNEPAQAVRAAVELQATLGEATAEDPTLPLLVGIGVDAGEVV